MNKTEKIAENESGAGLYITICECLTTQKTNKISIYTCVANNKNEAVGSAINSLIDNPDNLNYSVLHVTFLGEHKLLTALNHTRILKKKEEKINGRNNL